MIRRFYNPHLCSWYWSADGIDWYADNFRNPEEFT